jgi:hypothetical protein
VTPDAAVALCAAIGRVVYEEWPDVETDSDARMAIAVLAELASALVRDDPAGQHQLIARLWSLAERPGQ